MGYLMAQLADDLVDRIRKRLDVTKTSKTALALYLGVARSTIWTFFSGKHEITLDNEQLERLADFLGVPVSSLFKNDTTQAFDVCNFDSVLFKYETVPTLPPVIADVEYFGLKDKTNYRAIISECDYGAILQGDILLISIDEEQKILSGKLYYLVLEDQVCIRKLRQNPFSETIEILNSSDKVEYALHFKELNDKVKRYYQILMVERFTN